MNNLKSVAGGMGPTNTPIVVSGQDTPTSGHTYIGRFKEDDQGQGQLNLISGSNNLPHKGKSTQNTNEAERKKSQLVVSVAESVPDDGVSVTVH